MSAPVKPEDLTDEMIKAFANSGSLEDKALAMAATRVYYTAGQLTERNAARARICAAINARAGKEK